jgi:aldose 1-epimerase
MPLQSRRLFFGAMNDSLQIAAVKMPPSANFNKIADDRPVRLYKLRNKNGLEATITNHGARLVSLLAPDMQGNLINVVHDLDLNNCEDNSRNVIWDARQVDNRTVVLRYPSKSRAGRLPGNLKVKASYILNDDNGLKIIYEAADKAAAVNPADGVFFNLNGVNNGNILNHQVWIKADNYMQIDPEHSLNGTVEHVGGTPFDFRNSATIGSRINDHHMQLTHGNGYNHNFVLNKHASRTPVARVRGDKSGIIMEVYTEQPGLNFYSGNYMYSTHNKSSDKEDCHIAFAMKACHFADLPARQEFPSIMSKPGQVYKYVSLYLLKN